jgi:hypothetical protein
MSRNRHRRRPPAVVERSGFWGVPDAGEPEVERVIPTPDPGALPRSLGDPPLAINPAIAARHLDAVYSEAVRVATALAAANGLIDSSDED